MIRLHVPSPSPPPPPSPHARPVALSDPGHAAEGSGHELLVFNGRDGEWRCTVAEVLKKGVHSLRAEEQARPQT